MNQVASRIVFVVFVTVAVLPFGAGPAAAASTGLPDMGTIDAYVKSQMDDAHLPGIAVGIVYGGDVVHVRGFGRADPSGHPVTTHTPFVIGSVSKSFTALGVMQLVEAGKVELATPAQHYVNDFRLGDGSNGSDITVRELLNQTSGIPTSAGIDPLTAPVTTLDGQVAMLSQVKPQSAPGTGFAYSNANYEVLGRLIEDVSAESYGDYLAQHIFAPLGMSDSFTSVDAGRADQLAGGCEIWFGLQHCLEPGTGFRPDFVPAGFVLSSIEDMSRYVAAQMNGGSYASASILSATLVDQMHAPVAAAGLSAQGGAYGMGWFVGPRAGIHDTIWHNGSAAASHSMVLMLPNSGWGVVILTNAESLLYEMLGRIDVIADGIAAILVHSRAPGTLAGLYIGFDVVVVLIFALQLRTMLRLVRRPEAIPPRSSRIRTVLFAVLIPVWRELWVPIAILVGLPAALSAPWINLAQTDVGAFALGLSVMLLLTGVVRSYRTRNAWRPRLRRLAGDGVVALWPRAHPTSERS